MSNITPINPDQPTGPPPTTDQHKNYGHSSDGATKIPQPKPRPVTNPNPLEKAPTNIPEFGTMVRAEVFGWKESRDPEYQADQNHDGPDYVGVPQFVAGALHGQRVKTLWGSYNKYLVAGYPVLPETIESLEESVGLEPAPPTGPGQRGAPGKRSAPRKAAGPVRKATKKSAGSPGSGGGASNQGSAGRSGGAAS